MSVALALLYILSLIGCLGCVVIIFYAHKLEDQGELVGFAVLTAGLSVVPYVNTILLIFWLAAFSRGAK